MKAEIRALADRYAAELKRSIDKRVAAMEEDDRSHVLIYQVLGVSESEGKLIDVYQNKGRFLYKYAGSFLEEAVELLAEKFGAPVKKKVVKKVVKKAVAKAVEKAAAKIVEEPAVASKAATVKKVAAKKPAARRKKAA